MMIISHKWSFAVKQQNGGNGPQRRPSRSAGNIWIWKINGSSALFSIVFATSGCVNSFQVHNIKYMPTQCIWRIWKHSIMNPSPYITLHWVCVTSGSVASDLKANLRLHLYWLMFTIGYYLPVCGRLNFRWVWGAALSVRSLLYIHSRQRAQLDVLRAMLYWSYDKLSSNMFPRCCAQIFQITVWLRYRLGRSRQTKQKRIKVRGEVSFLLLSGQVFGWLLWPWTLSHTSHLYRISEKKGLFLSWLQALLKLIHSYWSC